jgi:hypothetical protein
MKHVKHPAKIGAVAMLLAVLYFGGGNHNSPGSANYEPGLYLGDTPVEAFTGEPSLENISA